MLQENAHHYKSQQKEQSPHAVDDMYRWRKQIIPDLEQALWIRSDTKEKEGGSKLNEKSIIMPRL